MNTTVTAASAVPPAANRVSAPAAPASPQTTSMPDRIEAGLVASAPLLATGAVVLSQFIPGTVEIEGAFAIATAVRIGAAAAMKNPVVAAAAGAVATSAFGYVKSLAGDAMNNQPALKPMIDAGNSLDTSIRSGLGIPPKTDR